MTIIQDLERQHRKREFRRVTRSSIVLCLTIVLAFAVSAVSKPDGPDPKVAQLERVNQKQADQLAQLRQLFTYCRTSVSWDNDERCVNPVDTGRGSSFTVSDPYVRTVRDSDDDDDDDGTDTTVVVQPPQPKVSPSRGSQRPDPETDQDTRGPVDRNGGNDNRHRGNGDRGPKRDRK